MFVDYVAIACMLASSPVQADSRHVTALTQPVQPPCRVTGKPPASAPWRDLVARLVVRAKDLSRLGDRAASWLFVGRNERFPVSCRYLLRMLMGEAGRGHGAPAAPGSRGGTHVGKTQAAVWMHGPNRRGISHPCGRESESIM